MIDWVLKKSGCAIKVEMGRTLDRVGPVHAAHGRYKRVGPVHAARGRYKRVGPVHAARGRTRGSVGFEIKSTIVHLCNYLLKNTFKIDKNESLPQTQIV